MPLGVARLAAGTLEPNAVKSWNPTRRASIYNDQEGDIDAVVKALPLKQLANELVAAVFLENLNLRAPRGYLVFAEEQDSFSNAAPLHSSGLRMYFGSTFKDHPLFLHRLQEDEAAAIEFITNYPEWGDVVGFDEWVANVDRHSHNLLYDGSNLLMFDHDRCLTGLNWNAADWIADKSYDPHKFITSLHSLMSEEMRKKAVQRAILVAEAVSKIDIEAVLEGSHIIELGTEIQAALDPMRQFLVARVAHIAKLSGARLSGARLSVGGLV